jgi:hypothetical protein
MFWDGVGKSSGRSCERVSMTSSRSPSLIFRVPLFDHPPNVFNLEKKGKGREEGGGNYLLLLYMEVFSGKNVLQEWLGILSISRDSLLPPECWSSGFLAGKASC